MRVWQTWVNCARFCSNNAMWGCPVPWLPHCRVLEESPFCQKRPHAYTSPYTQLQWRGCMVSYTYLDPPCVEQMLNEPGGAPMSLDQHLGMKMSFIWPLAVCARSGVFKRWYRSISEPAAYFLTGQFLCFARALGFNIKPFKRPPTSTLAWTKTAYRLYTDRYVHAGTLIIVFLCTVLV